MTLWETAIRFSVDLVLKATILFLITAGALLLLRRASAATRHFVGVLGLSASLLLPFLSLALPRVPLPLIPDPRPAPAAPRPEAPNAELAFASDVESESASVDGDFSWRQLALSVPERAVVAPDAPLPEAAPSPASAPRRVRPSLPAVALALWGFGALFVSARLMVGWTRVRRISREAALVRDPEWIAERDDAAQRLELSRRVPLLESESVPVAMTIGLLRPLLLLGRAARSWALERRRVVLLHELAHVKRGDWPALLLAEIAAAVYWFHPVAWWISRRVRRDAETACDDLVIAAGTKPSVYAGHLLGIFRALSAPAHPVAPALAMVRPHQFEERLRAILDPRSPREHETRARARFAATGLLAAAAIVAAVEPWKPVEAQPTLLAMSALPAPKDSPSPSPSASCAPKKCNSKKAVAPAVESSAVEAEPIEEAAPAEQATPAGAPEGFAPAVAPAEPAEISDEAAPETAPPTQSEETEAKSLQAVPAIMKFEAKQSPSESTGFVKAGHRKSGQDWYSRGMGYHHDEDYAKSIEAFKKAIEAGDQEEAATYNIACGYALMGDTNHAFEWLNKALESGFDVGDYMMRDDDLDSLHADPRWAELKKVARSSTSSRHERETKSVVTRYERIIAKSPKSGEMFFDVAHDLLQVDQYDLAARAYQAAIERGYRLGTSYYNRACALSLAGDKRGALDMLAQSLANGFDQPDHFRTDDDLDNVRGEPRFKELQKEAKDLSLPSYNSWWNQRWHSRAERTKWRDAAERFEEYAQRNPNNGRAWYNLGFASLAGDRPESAVEAFQKALNLNYRKSTTMYNLACAYARLDQKDPAFDWLFKAIDAGFDSPDHIRSDEDLDNLRGDPRYRKAIQVARARDRQDEEAED